MSNYYLNSYDSTPLFVHAWDEVAEPKALVLLLHDVGEHSGRYASFAAAFNRLGFVVIAYDQRTMGATARPDRVGMGNKDTFGMSVEDVIFLYRYFSREYHLPILMAGAGYGAYQVLAALQKEIIHPIGVMLLSIGKLSHQALLAVAASAKALPAKDRRTLGLATLAHLGGKENPDAVVDPLLGVVPNVAMVASYTDGLLALTKEQALAKLNRQVPYALFEGMQDPVLGKDGEAAVALLVDLRARGFDPRFFGYEDVGHDVANHHLNERFFGHMITFAERCLSEAE